TDEYGRQLVDGGLVANIPSGVARSLGAEIVIAVDVNAEGARFLGPSLSILSVVLQSMLLVQRTAAMHQLEKADVVIRPKVGHIRWDEMRRADELIAAGYDAAMERMPEIKQVIQAASGFTPKWYQLRRRKQPESKRQIISPG
ncbi:MAG TPA: hypothetical protein VI750_13555, partial [Pyrinomonadaceae bacterium]|nr:hypothetical protein [Pyrinomonadaceae bacterium]